MLGAESSDLGESEEYEERDSPRASRMRFLASCVSSHKSGALV